MLIYPYYTVNAGNDTLRSVVNTPNEGKAMKVRFLEGRNSREVLDFNLYLSPFDVWTAAVTTAGALATDPAVLTTNDNGCTVPNIRLNSGLPVFAGTANRFVAFRNFQYAGSDSGPDSLDRTREGHFEMIEMGLVNNLGAPAFGLEPAIATLNTLRNITHVPGTGIASNCGAVNANWQTLGNTTAYTPTGALNTQIDTTAPTGGLFGGAAIVHVANGTYINYSADALADFRAISFHTGPGELAPTLGFANNVPTGAVVDAFGTIPAGGARSVVLDNGRLLVQNWPSAAGATRPGGQLVRSIDAVSAVLAQDTLFNEFITVLAQDTLFNEFITAPELGASSEWVITFPTKRFYVDQTLVGASAVQPFARVFPSSSMLDGLGRACVEIQLRRRYRERGDGSNTLFNFPPAPSPPLCCRAQVLTFNQGSAQSRIMGATYPRNVNTTNSMFQNPTQLDSSDGWASIRFLQAQRSATALSNRSCTGADCAVGAQSFSFAGLPATGFWALTIANNNAAPNVRGNFGGAFRHRGLRSCFGAQTGNPLCATP